MDAEAMVAVRAAKDEVTRAWRHTEEGRAAMREGSKRKAVGKSANTGGMLSDLMNMGA